MKSPFAAFGALTGLFGVAMFLFAFSQFTMLENSLMSGDGAPEAPRPVEETAPEAAALRSEFRELVEKGIPAAANCASKDPQKEIPALEGEALIWDNSTDDVSVAHGNLPKEIRAKSAAGKLALFVIARQSEVQLSSVYFEQRADSKGIKSYRVDTEICVVQMPERKSLGRFKIEGNAPPFKVRADDQVKDKVVGNWRPAVAKWVESCVRGKQWRDKKSMPEGQWELKQLATAATEALSKCHKSVEDKPGVQLPRRVLIWNYQPEYQLDFVHAAAMNALPESLRARPDDTNVTVVLITGSKYMQNEKKNIDRFDQTVAIVAMPGAIPIGRYALRGEEFSRNIPRNGSHPENLSNHLAHWITSFIPPNE